MDTTIPIRDIGSTRVPHTTLDYVPQNSAEHYKLVPIGLADEVLEVGMVNPDDIEALDALNFITRKSGIPFKLYKITEEDFRKVIDMYKGLTGEVSSALDELDTQLSNEEQSIQAEINKQEQGVGEQLREDAPVIKIVATILRYAVEGRASDVHIEQGEGGVKVRFRVDGILHTSITLPRRVHQSMVARIKVLSNLRLDERRKPQDGRFSAVIGGGKVDFRVSTFPTYDGEKVVMRILDRDKGFVSIDDLGLIDRYKKMVKDAIQRPHGLILISGPTGSGKSTTLYSMLNAIDRNTKNVLSLEDPVEYYIDGVNQSQMRPEIGYDFANGLRTTLRQDPDVIMVGEIRDAETARLAIQAALTGHLVLSTIHTNSATGIISRLINMGIDPYLIAPTLVLGMAQRLVRRICPNTGIPTPITPSMRTMLENEFAGLAPEYVPPMPNEVLAVETGSKECPSGTRGRIAVFEMFETSSELEQTILNTPTDDRLREAVLKQGMLTMKQDAIIKAFDKKIPFSEVHALGGLLFAESGDMEAAKAEAEIAPETKPAEMTPDAV
jgi:type IV pilus assembly protein PilB